MKLQKDLSELIKLLLSENVEFVLVGGYALEVHGAPRFTEDIDFLIQVSPRNADRVVKAIKGFGFGSLNNTRTDFLEPDFIIQLGMPPNRIGIITGIEGVEWEEVWQNKITHTFDDAELLCDWKSGTLKK